ncbi:MAG: sodium:proline symporter, partial [Negativicoccus succinicivorans]|nr:sodium:proline symporter [Negativicoccus succinicivorans]
MVYIGMYYYRRSNELSDYILGGRSLGPWITSMSAEASDMSGWMLMGLPGLAYLSGLPAMWTAVGLALGTWANWVFISKRLRNYTEIANDSLTIPDFLNNRFHDHSNMLNLVS